MAIALGGGVLSRWWWGDVVVHESDGGQVQVSQLLRCATPPVFVLTTPVSGPKITRAH